MITIDYIGRGGVQKKPKSDYVILEQPLTGTMVDLPDTMVDPFYTLPS